MNDSIAKGTGRPGGPEPAAIAGWSFLAAATLGFLLLTVLVANGHSRAFDHRLLLAFRLADDPSRPIGPEWMFETARDITALGSTFVLALLTIGVVVYLALDRRYRAMTFVASSVLGGWLLSSGLKALIARSRPDLVPQLMKAYYSSYPSGHSMMSAVVYLTLGGLLARLSPSPRLRAFFLGLAALLAGVVGVSRVYLGVHYPTDVLAGWTAGSAWATLCWLLVRHPRRRGQIEAAA